MPKDQQSLPGEGFEPPTIKAIETAAVAYLDRRAKFQKASEAVQESKTKLIEVMQAHAEKLEANENGDKVYRYDDEIVILSDKVNVKVKAAEEEEEA